MEKSIKCLAKGINRNLEVGENRKYRWPGQLRRGEGKAKDKVRTCIQHNKVTYETLTLCVSGAGEAWSVGRIKCLLRKGYPDYGHATLNKPHLI